MADFRKPKYSGSLNLAPECGPVHIELDTDAKTATASLEDPASQYTLAGGGGGLEYVIPEQTVTYTDTPVEINANLTEGLTPFPLKLLQTGIPGTLTTYMNTHWTIESSDWTATATTFIGFVVISKNESGTFVEFLNSNEEPMPGTFTISAIRGF